MPLHLTSCECHGRVITAFVFPPIPDRRWDWSAVTDNYEPGAAIGWGRTEAEAIADLLELIDDGESP